MTISAKLLNGNIINRDADFSKYIETVSEAWVIEGFQVSANAVAKWKARVPCERSNGEKLFVLVLNDNNIPIDWNGDVYINIAQSHIDNWELSSDDGTGIATIEVWTMPSKNALKLAVKNGSTITDERNMLKKISDLEGLIDWIEERTATLEEEIGEILDKWAIDHLEESWIVWEKYTLSDTLFHQLEPISSNCTLEQNVADVSANTEIHIQRIASWTENNQLNLKLKKVWAPTQNLIVEVRRGVKVDVSSNEAYWYWDEVITSSEIPYGNITTDFAEYTVTFPESFWANQWDLLDIVLYQNWKIVNDINYYVIACDSTQYSEAYSFVAVNGETRVRSKLMPYCSSVGFAQSLLCKVKTWEYCKEVYRDNTEQYKQWTSDDTTLTYTVTETWYYYFNADLKWPTSNGGSIYWNTTNSTTRVDDIFRTSIWKTGNEYRTYKSDRFYLTAGQTLYVKRFAAASGTSERVYRKNTYIQKILIEDYKKSVEDYDWNINWYLWRKSWQFSNETKTYVVQASWNYTINYTLWANASNSNANVSIKVNWVEIAKTYNKTTELSYYIRPYLKLWDILTITHNKSTSTTATATCKTWIYSWMPNTGFFRILYPQKIDTIWNKTQAVIYWKLWDEYITDFDFNLVTSVQTWNITLWNAIWFIQLKYRWITYKIPVYW